jgi:hypothetical protein
MDREETQEESQQNSNSRSFRTEETYHGAERRGGASEGATSLRNEKGKSCNGNGEEISHHLSIEN